MEDFRFVPMPTINELSAKFGELNDAELRIVKEHRSTFPVEVELTPESMLQWGEDRVIRAEVLAAAVRGGTDIILIGAVIRGLLDLTGADVGALTLTHCRIDDITTDRRTSFNDSAHFDDSLFTGSTVFDDARFADVASFSNATFATDASFYRSSFHIANFRGTNFLKFADFRFGRFANMASFNDARFDGFADFSDAIFSKLSEFASTEFHGNTWFYKALFESDALFREAKFSQNITFSHAKFLQSVSFVSVKILSARAEFSETIFKEQADFSESTFTSGANFSNSIFYIAEFAEVNFGGAAYFIRCRFLSSATFTRSVFAKNLSLYGSVFNTLKLNDCRFDNTISGSFAGRYVDLSGSIFNVRINIEIAAIEVALNSIQARGGCHLLVRAKSTDLSSAEFIEPSILDGGGPIRLDVPLLPGRANSLSVYEMAAKTEAWNFGRHLLQEFSSTPECTAVTSMRHANVSDIMLTKVDLQGCQFAGAHGLDAVRFGQGCIWPVIKKKRRAIAEEISWLHDNSVKSLPEDTADNTDDVVSQEVKSTVADVLSNTKFSKVHPHEGVLVLHGAAVAPPAPSEIAETYRSLRKGLEDSKNEPGAADFYYGEMQMRRLSGAKRVRTFDSSSPRAEHWLLVAYWVVSGYGLRASRAIGWLAALLLVCSVAFTLPAFARLPTPAAQISTINPDTGAVTYAPAPNFDSSVSWGQSAEFTARESLALFRIAGAPALDTTGWGAVLDIVLRFLSPILLALAALAIRGRTKR